MLIKNPFIYTTLKIFLHIIPAILLDIGLILTMNKPRYVTSIEVNSNTDNDFICEIDISFSLQPSVPNLFH